jgi:head-tail adaptor
MPAAQGEVTNREIRFTLRFRRTITIAARSASSSFVTGPAATAVAQLLRPFGVHGAADTEFASDDAPGTAGGSETTDACE